jgi:hypothetical protein
MIRPDLREDARYTSISPDHDDWDSCHDDTDDDDAWPRMELTDICTAIGITLCVAAMAWLAWLLLS